MTEQPPAGNVIADELTAILKRHGARTANQSEAIYRSAAGIITRLMHAGYVIRRIRRQPPHKAT